MANTGWFSRVALAVWVLFGLTGVSPARPIVWPVSDLARLLPTDSPPPPSAINLSVFLSGARGEYVSFGLGVHDDMPIFNLKTRISRLACPEQRSVITVPIQTRYARTVPVQANTRNTPLEELAFKAPADVPDPLMPEIPLPLEANRVALLWVTIQVPYDAHPGHYTGSVTVTVSGLPVALPVALDVWNFEIPVKRHLQVTMWFNDTAMSRAHGVERFSKEYWRFLAAYAADIADHRQNAFLVPLDLIQLKNEGGGKISCNFDHFDRYIQTFLDAGPMDLIELGHLAHFGQDGWTGSDIAWRNFNIEGGETSDEQSRATVIAGFLRELAMHLREQGWLEKSAIHVADEPSVNNLASWKERSAMVGRLAPGLRRIDAIEAEDFNGFLEIWVPKLQVIEPWHEPLQRAKASGAELWFYTCCHPYGVYPNRFLDNTLLQVRLLPWMAARYGLKGYLHWGLNQWSEDPYQHAARGELPPGDHSIIYPGKDGPIDSIRWEAFRDGLEDFEYLCVLEERLAALKKELGPGAAFLSPHQRPEELVRKLVPDAIRYSRSPEDLQDMRLRIANEINDLDTAPLLLVQTSPPEGTELGVGPATVLVRGITDPNAAVTVNEKEMKVNSQGYFAAHIFVTPKSPEITIVSETGGSRHEIRRGFDVVDSVPRE
ncbi:MAG: glycoside hydrolase domain-containing protein [bacterium]